MDPIYPKFAATDALFYDLPPTRVSSDAPDDDGFASHLGFPWNAWDHVDDGPWSMLVHPEANIPEQGWKIHLSAIQANALVTLSATAEYCRREKLPFKFLRTRADLERSLAKDTDRGIAGKFITIYPPREDSLLACLLELDEVLGGSAGPYILSDLRWNAGPLHVRYGGFRQRFTVHRGVEVLAIQDPRTGTLVPDPREAGFQLPPWVDPPSLIREQIESLDAAAPSGFPEITAALHFSNAGGVYSAVVAGEPLVLKEARPYAGWTPDGRDAVDRLISEERALRRAALTVRVPRVRGVYEVHGHRFLALDRIPGRALSEIVASTNPLTIANATPSDFASYRDWALGVLAELRVQLLALHAIGLAHGDLHPGNVLVDEAGAVGLIDLEMAVAVDSDTEAVLGARGFVSRGVGNSAERDLYALACTELHAFVPLTPLIELHRGIAEQLIAKAAGLFDLPRAWVDRVTGTLVAPGDAVELATKTRPDLERVASRLCADATPYRDDRLWPGDPRQFSESLLSLAHGPLGVAIVLDRAGRSLPAHYLDWLQRALRRDQPRVSNGLLDGRAGALWACKQLGFQEEAERLADELACCDWSELSSDLYSGLPGIGLSFLAESSRDPVLLDRAAQILSELDGRWAAASPASRVTVRGGGLLAGASGTALLALRLYESTEDASFLRSAHRALMVDLASLREGEDGSLQLNEGWRTLPYLGYGSVGIGVVLAQYLRHAPDDEQLTAVLRGVTTAACTPFTVQSGLLSGRAGLIYYLLMLESSGGSTDRTTASLNYHLDELALHALPEGRFVGDGLLRASCDLATGSAGVLAALMAARMSEERVAPWCPIPYLMPPPAAWDAVDRHGRSRGGDTYGLHPVSSDARTR